MYLSILSNLLTYRDKIQMEDNNKLIYPIHVIYRINNKILLRPQTLHDLHIPSNNISRPISIYY